MYQSVTCSTQFLVNLTAFTQNKKVSSGVSGSGSDKLGDLIILGLSYKATEADVKEYFQTYGEIKSCEVKFAARLLQLGIEALHIWTW